MFIKGVREKTKCSKPEFVQSLKVFPCMSKNLVFEKTMFLYDFVCIYSIFVTTISIKTYLNCTNCTFEE